MMDGMDSEQEWIASILAPKTRENYTRGFRRFKEWLDTDAEGILELRKEEGKRFTTRIVQYFNWRSKQVSENSARTEIVALQSFVTYWDLTLKLKMLPPISSKVEDYYPVLEDLQAMYRYNDLDTKAWISLARDSPARISDLLKISPEDIAKGEKMVKSQKERVVGWMFFSDQTRELWSKNPNIPRTQRGIAKLLERACEVAKVHVWNCHLFRKYFTTIATNLQLNEKVVKALIFKTVGESDSTYYFRIHDELKNAWQKVVNAIPLELKNGRVSDLEKRMTLMTLALKKYYKFIHAWKPSKTTTYVSDMQVDEMSEEEFLARFVEG
jgi:integrase